MEPTQKPGFIRNPYAFASDLGAMSKQGNRNPYEFPACSPKTSIRV